MAQYLRRRDVCKRYGIPVSTLYYWLGIGRFPRPVRLGARVVAWSVADLEEWERSRAAERDAPR